MLRHSSSFVRVSFGRRVVVLTFVAAGFLAGASGPTAALAMPAGSEVAIAAGAAAAQTPPPAAAPVVPPAPTVAPSETVVGHVSEGPGSWWAYIKGDRVTTRGSGDDPRITALRKAGPVFWFVRADREYVVSDEATLREVEQIVAPVDALGAKQTALAAGASQAAAKQATTTAAAGASPGQGAQMGSSAGQGQAPARTVGTSGTAAATPEQQALAKEMDRAAAVVERQIADLISRTLADGRAKPLKTQ